MHGDSLDQTLNGLLIQNVDQIKNGNALTGE